MFSGRIVSLIFILIVSVAQIFGQSKEPYFQQQVNYRIDVILDDVNHTLQGKEQVHYINNSPDTLKFIYFHLYPNAYKNRKTALAKQFIRNKEDKFHFANEEQRGWIDGLDFRDEMGKLNWEYDPEHIDVCKVYLRNPLPPRGSTRILTPFVVKIPGDFSRLGHVGQSYQISQWYPKPAVYDRDGWHAMPYLNQGEFYSEFGNFEVRIQLPATYRVAATGVLQEAEELFWLELLSREYEFPGEGIVHRLDSNRLNKTKTITFKQEKIHDFAFFCSKDYIVKKEVANLDNGSQVDCWAYYNPKLGTHWERGAEYVKRSVEYYSKMVGPYPYVSATAVEGALSAGGGMEYPMVTVVSAGSTGRELDNIITHEVGHNWFYGILASNEREHAWLDEGFNSYIEQLYMRQYYPDLTWLEAAGIPTKVKTRFGARHFLYMTANLYAGYGYQFPINTPSPELPAMQYGLLSYQRTAFLLDYLYEYLGQEVFIKCLQEYFRIWQFQHPGPADVQMVFEETSGKSLNWFFDELFNTEKQFDYVPAKLKVEEGNYQLVVRNKGSVQAPYPVRLIQADTVLATYWFDGHIKKKRVLIPYQSADALVLDGNYQTSDLSVRNNRIRTSGGFKKIDPVRITFGTGIPEYHLNKLYVLPSLGFNTTDGFMLGGIIHNYDVLGKRFNYMLMPMYGFESNTLAGSAMVKYDWFVRDKFLKKVRLMGEYKRFADFDKVDPSVNLFYQSNGRFRTKYWMGLSHAVVFHRNAEASNLNATNQFTRLRLNQRRKSALMEETIFASIMMIHADNPGLRTEIRFERNDKIHKRGRLGYRAYFGVQMDEFNDNYFNLYGTGSPDIARDYYMIDRAGNGRAGWLGSNQALMDQGGFMSMLYSGSPYLLSLNLNYDYYNVSRVYVHGLMINNATYIESGLGLVGGLFDVYFPIYSSAFVNGFPQNWNQWGRSIRFVLRMNLESPFNQVELF